MDVCVLLAHDFSGVVFSVQNLLRDCLSLEAAPLELHPVDHPSPHGPVDVLLEEPPVGLELVGGLLVERVLGVGLQEQVLEAVDYGVYGQDRLPVLAENVQADVALCE